MSIETIRALIRMRELMAASKNVAVRVERLALGQQRSASVIKMLGISTDWLLTRNTGIISSALLEIRRFPHILRMVPVGRQ